MDPLGNAESGMRICTQRPAGKFPEKLLSGKEAEELPRNSATWRPSPVLDSVMKGRSAAEIPCGAKHQKERWLPSNPGKRLRKFTTCNSASHPPPGFDRHSRRSAFGGVRKVFVSTGSLEFFCTRVLGADALAEL